MSRLVGLKREMGCFGHGLNELISCIIKIVSTFMNVITIITDAIV